MCFFKYNPIPHFFFFIPPIQSSFFTTPSSLFFSMLDTPIQDEEDATTRCRREQGGFIRRFITKTRESVDTCRFGLKV